MISKNQIKLVRSLSQKKFRKDSGLFVAEGTKSVIELLDSKLECHSFYATDAWRSDQQTLATEPELISSRELEQISGFRSPAGVLGVFRIPAETEVSVPGDGLTLLLDRVGDPGNLGTIIRIADWFGLSQLVLSPDSADPYNPKVVQASMGSISRIRLATADLPELIAAAKTLAPDLTISGAVMQGTALFGAPLSNPGWLVMGSESHGISDEVEALLDQRLTIPAFGKAESLNVGVATALFCAEYRR